jgi:hypothetical protein
MFIQRRGEHLRVLIDTEDKNGSEEQGRMYYDCALAFWSGLSIIYIYALLQLWHLLNTPTLFLLGPSPCVLAHLGATSVCLWEPDLVHDG